GRAPDSVRLWRLDPGAGRRDGEPAPRALPRGQERADVHPAGGPSGLRMSQLELTAEEQGLHGFVARAGAEVFRPRAEAWGERDELNRELARALGKEGVFPLLVPAAYGGALEGPFRSVTLCVVREALARTCPAAEELFAIQGLGCYPILLAGSEAQKERWLPGLARGEQVPAFALTEPDAGSDAAALTTRAERAGDGWVLRGAKRFISNAPAADLYVLFAKTAPDRGSKGISAFLVPRETPGLT